MAGITTAERDARQAQAETCPHLREHIGRWHWYADTGVWGRRIRCQDCRFWYVEEWTGGAP